MGPGFGASVSTSPPLHFARPPTPGASSWPGATLAIQGGIEGERRPHPSSGRKARREGEEKAPLPFNGLWDCTYIMAVQRTYGTVVSVLRAKNIAWNAWPVPGRWSQYRIARW